MRQLPIVIVLIIITGCDFKSSEEYHKEANAFEEQEKFREAIALLDKAIEKNQHNIRALLDRAVDRSIVNDYKGSIEDYSKVVEVDPNNTLAYFNRGKNKMRIEDHQGAIADFNKAISTKGGEYLYMEKVANSFADTGFEFDVRMESIRFERGIAWYTVDSVRLAFNDFSVAIQKNYMLPDSYYWRGLIYLRFNMKREACSDFKVAKNFGHPDAQEMLATYCE
jgi:tetratricopeptide (TPR) repeat protein